MISSVGQRGRQAFQTPVLAIQVTTWSILDLYPFLGKAFSAPSSALGAYTTLAGYSSGGRRSFSPGSSCAMAF
jgi:hypothetical protein